MEISLIVALIAALASLSGAVMAFIAARHAQQSAQQINNLNLDIARLDKNADELRDAYKALTESMGARSLTSDQGAMIAGAAAALAGCLGASEELRKACENVENDVEIVYKLSRQFPEKLADSLHTTPPKALRDAYYECQQRIAAERKKLLAQKAKARD